ncbi:MtrAB system histidine kinase MtrB, partial [Arcanobacterium canis]
ALTIPSAGQYELYAAYSLSSQESLIRSTFRALTFSVVALIVLLAFVSWLIMRLVLRPVQEASASAHQLAEGEFEARMEVRGTDELAQLARSFNQMASSLEDQFTKMERMSKVQTDFVSAVSHELRSPVTTIRMAGQLIFDKREELSPALRRSAELQHDQLKNLEMMLSDLLEISRYDAGGTSLATKPTDVGELARTVIELADPLAQDNGVTVSISVEGNPEAEIEPRRIERILRNLVVNALEHAEGNPVSVRIVGNDTAVAAEVMDWGIGLDDEQAAHVFDRFWRADSSRVRKTGGTGLGLTIAKEDALIHGGTLEATGVMGVGSTFLLTIPKTPHTPFIAPIDLVAPEPRTADLAVVTMHDEEEK